MFGCKRLQAEISKQLSRIIDLENEREKWHQGIIENQKLHKRNAELTLAINKLEPQIRKQTEADLFFVSAKICFELFNGKPEKEIKTLIKYQQTLQSRVAAALQQYMTPFYGSLSSYGGSGLFGGLSGRW